MDDSLAGAQWAAVSAHLHLLEVGEQRCPPSTGLEGRWLASELRARTRALEDEIAARASSEVMEQSLRKTARVLSGAHEAWGATRSEASSGTQPIAARLAALSERLAARQRETDRCWEGARGQLGLVWHALLAGALERCRSGSCEVATARSQRVHETLHGGLWGLWERSEHLRGALSAYEEAARSCSDPLRGVEGGLRAGLRALLDAAHGECEQIEASLVRLSGPSPLARSAPARARYASAQREARGALDHHLRELEEAVSRAPLRPMVCVGWWADTYGSEPHQPIVLAGLGERREVAGWFSACAVVPEYYAAWLSARVAESGFHNGAQLQAAPLPAAALEAAGGPREVASLAATLALEGWSGEVAAGARGGREGFGAHVEAALACLRS